MISLLQVEDCLITRWNFIKQFFLMLRELILWYISCVTLLSRCLIFKQKLFLTLLSKFIKISKFCHLTLSFYETVIHVTANLSVKRASIRRCTMRHSPRSRQTKENPLADNTLIRQVYIIHTACARVLIS